MRSAALLVDAGYLYSGGAATVFGGVYRRRDLRLRDVDGLVDRVKQLAADCCDGEPLRTLRTYWYDGAVDGVPTQEQVRIGELPRVKLRLGRVTPGGQKGVDGLIILDLINLARNRAVDVVILLTGDEDLREAAAFAQGFGISLMVAGFPAGVSHAQSRLLLREADHVLTLGRDDLLPHLSVAPRDSAITAPSPAEANDAITPDRTDAEEALVDVCRGVVGDPRLAGGSEVLDPSGDRLSTRADKILVARLSDLTGTFPVEPTLLRRARQVCRDLARRDTRSAP